MYRNKIRCVQFECEWYFMIVRSKSSGQTFDTNLVNDTSIENMDEDIPCKMVNEWQQ